MAKWNVEEIEGAFFHLVESESWKCCASRVSLDKNRLCRIYQVADGTFRVQRFTRASGAPQWQGDWWGESGDLSITDTLEQAGRLAQEYLTGVQP
jgi:hypothetical protein